ncbi:MAG: VOC family protein [Rubrobacter sp.]|nr:VOC family protein [Rubrobacter sp.]
MIKVTEADHTNWRVRDIEASLRFYRDLLGLEPFGLDEYQRKGRGLVSLRVTPTFIIHLQPDPEFERSATGGYDHLALVVEGDDVDALQRKLEDVGVEIERRMAGVTGARGDGEAIYVRDPDGYLIELKVYP